MQILQWLVPSNYELILFGDNQEGNALTYQKGYASCIDYILSGKHRYAFHMGDEQEGYWIDDPRYDPATLLADPLAQQKQVKKDLGPLAKAKRLIAIMYSNHTHALLRKIGNITKTTCDELGVQYGGFSAVGDLVDKYGIQFKGFFTHGRKLIRSIADDPVRRLANEKLQLKQHLKHKSGECLLMAKGHTHRLIICEPHAQLYLTVEDKEDRKNIRQHYTHNPPFGKGGYIHPDHRWYVNTGSFLKTFTEGITSYSEMGEYDPVELGYAVVEVNDRQITNVRKVVV